MNLLARTTICRYDRIIGGEGAMYDTIREHIQAMIKGESGVIIMGSEDGLTFSVGNSVSPSVAMTGS